MGVTKCLLHIVEKEQSCSLARRAVTKCLLHIVEKEQSPTLTMRAKHTSHGGDQMSPAYC